MFDMWHDRYINHMLMSYSICIYPNEVMNDSLIFISLLIKRIKNHKIFPIRKCKI